MRLRGFITVLMAVAPFENLFYLPEPCYIPVEPKYTQDTVEMFAAPRIVTQLTPAVLNASVKVYSGEVSTISGGSRKKRAEVALAIDGEGIEVHDV